MSMIEYSVTIKDECSKLTEKEHTTLPLTLNGKEPLIEALIEKALAKFKINSESEAPTIIIKTKTIIQ